MKNKILRTACALVILIVSLTACPIPIVRPYIARLERTTEALVNQPFSTSASLTGQIDGTAFVISGNYSNFVNDSTAIQSTGLVTSVVVSVPSISNSVCNLGFTSQTVEPQSSLPYISFFGQITGRCDVSGNTTAWLDALNGSKVEVIIKSANFPNGVVKGVFIPQ